MALPFSLETFPTKFMTYSLWQKPLGHSQNVTVDVAIVGAGLTGLSLAYWLTELQPGLQVMVLDRQGLGTGASGRNAGFHTAGSASFLADMVQRLGTDEAGKWWQLKRRSLQMMRERLLCQFPDVDYQQAGSTGLYRDQRQLEEIFERIKPIETATQLSKAELVGQGLQGFSGGLHLAQDASFHPMKFLQNLHQLLLKRGVLFQLDQTLGWINGDRLFTERGEVQAGQVFLAINGFASQFSAELGALVTPKRGQILAIQNPGLKLQGNFYDTAERVYFRLDHAGNLLLGGRRTADEAHEDTAVDHISPQVQAALERYAQSLVPQPKIVARWSGIMGFTADERPILYTLPQHPHVMFVGGYSGHGMGMAFGHAHSAVSKFLGVASGQ